MFTYFLTSSSLERLKSLRILVARLGPLILGISLSVRPGRGLSPGTKHIQNNAKSLKKPWTRHNRDRTCSQICLAILVVILSSWLYRTHFSWPKCTALVMNPSEVFLWPAEKPSHKTMPKPTAQDDYPAWQWPSSRPTGQDWQCIPSQTCGGALRHAFHVLGSKVYLQNTKIAWDKPQIICQSHNLKPSQGYHSSLKYVNNIRTILQIE